VAVSAMHCNALPRRQVPNQCHESIATYAGNSIKSSLVPFMLDEAAIPCPRHFLTQKKVLGVSTCRLEVQFGDTFRDEQGGRWCL
jgi:hypothetical protein